MFKHTYCTSRAIALITLCAAIICAAPGASHAASRDKSDFNRDLVVDEHDLALFSSSKLNQDWSSVDWCSFHADTMAGVTVFGIASKTTLKHHSTLLDFIYSYFDCGASPLALLNSPRFPARIALGDDPDKTFYVSDPKVGSVFIYDRELRLNAELKGLDTPLGLTLDTQGHVLVGNDGRDNVEVFNPEDGSLVTSFGDGLLQMPNAISTDPRGYIYVTDSKAGCLQVFDVGYNHAGTIGTPGSLNGELRFPVDAQIIGEEIFVADQVNMRIQVFDLEGSYLRSIDKGPCTRDVCQPPVFQRLQALAADTQGRLHALDILEARVTVFDPDSGTILGSYGGYGDGLLRLPTDLLVGATSDALITDAGHNTLKELVTP